MERHRLDWPRHIAQCLELAILFEVSSDKPGNVNLVTGFEGTSYEHFLASAVATTHSFELLARQGQAVGREEIKMKEIGIGRLIRNCVSEIRSWQKGGNTLLGTIILLSPIAVAAGMMVSASIKSDYFECLKLRKHIKSVVESTTPEDAVEVYKGIKIANPSGLGTAPELDINDPTTIDRILKERISLLDVFKIAATYDTVCSEWVNNYPVTFDTAYPHLQRLIMKKEGLNLAITHTFLHILACYPDTFIARKTGLEKAQEVSAMAIEVLKLGGLSTPEGKASLAEFDKMLRRSSNLLNPGTTADVIAAALSLCILEGYRP